MSGIMSSFYTGVSGLQASQNALNTTAHNMTNVGTPGYTRQQVLFSDAPYQTIGHNYFSSDQVGLGTYVSAVRQVRDQFLDKSYRNAVGEQGYFQVQYQTVSELEDVFGETEGVQFQDSLESFWAKLQEISKYPDDPTYRTTFIQTAVDFVERSQVIYKQMSDYQTSLNSEITKQVKRINDISAQINDLNQKICKYEAGVEHANDYRDQRNALLDELASYGEINYKEDSKGMVSVYFEGNELVSEINHTTLKLGPTADGSNLLSPYWDDNFDRPVYRLDRVFSSEEETTTGSLKGLIVARGSAAGIYTDIPVSPVKPSRSDYATDTDYTAANTQYQIDLAHYKEATAEYNIKINQSPVQSVQAQFDQLIHGIVTKINDALCPNKEVTLADGHDTKIMILDEDNAAWGMGDDNCVAGTELFKRATTDRYTKKTVTIKNDDGSTTTKDVMVYNQEDVNDRSTLYTINELKINPELLKNESLLPVTKNDGTGAYDSTVCDKIKNAWSDTFGTLDPNTTVKSTFKDYYTDMIGAMGNRGNTFKKVAANQEDTANSLDNQRQQTTGVNAEEELTKMLQYQHAYNASSRYFNVVDQMLEHLLSRLG